MGTRPERDRKFPKEMDKGVEIMFFLFNIPGWKRVVCVVVFDQVGERSLRFYTWKLGEKKIGFTQ